MIVQGRSMSLFQASQQWSTRSVSVNTRFESQLSRMNCQTFSAGLSSGHLGGSTTRVMLSGSSHVASRPGEVIHQPSRNGIRFEIDRNNRNSFGGRRGRERRIWTQRIDHLRSSANQLVHQLGYSPITPVR